MSAPPILVKPPQQRGDHGVSAVFVESAAAWEDAAGSRVFVKRQDAYWCRPVWRLFRRTPTLRRELRGIEACRGLGVPVPSVVAYREAGSRAELVLEEVCDAHPLDVALAAADADRATIVEQVAIAIGTLHRGGWSHGALYPSHILVGPGPSYRVTLIDLEKARHTRLRRHTDLARFWRHNPGMKPSERDAFMRRYAQVLHRGRKPDSV